MDNNLIKKIKEAGFYTTPLIKRIVTLLHKSRSPMSVNELLDRLSKTKLSPNKTTLYRQLTKLAEAGLVQEGLFSDEVRRYCLTLDEDHHHHFVCQECGYAERLPVNVCKQVANLTHALQARGHEVTTHTLDIEGLCKECASY